MEEHSSSTRQELWKQIYENFKSKFENWNSLYSHQGLKGDQNEENLINLLKSFIPGKFDLFQKAQILDLEGNKSNEQDIVIWDKINQPRIFSESKFFIIEQVHATIEVKTTLNKTTLEEAILNICNIRRMNFFKRLDGDPKWQIHPPLSFIFAYNMSWKKRGKISDIVEKVCKENDIKPEERFDYLYVMKNGIKLKWDIPTDPNFSGRVDFEKRYGKICPINLRWPQFFPSKLIKNIPLILHEIQSFKRGSLNGEKNIYDDENYQELNVENQIWGMHDFLSMLCQALEDQRKFYSFNNVSLSFSPFQKKSGVTKRSNPF